MDNRRKNADEKGMIIYLNLIFINIQLLIIVITKKKSFMHANNL